MSSVYPFPALLTPVPRIPLTTEEINCYTNEVAEGAKKAQRNLLSFFYFMFCFSVTPSINTPKSSNDFITFKLSFIFSFEIRKVNPFPVLTAPFPVTF